MFFSVPTGSITDDPVQKRAVTRGFLHFIIQRRVLFKRPCDNGEN